MALSDLYLFVDTNLFIQCHKLEELDWSMWSEFEKVILLVTPPVMREIDKHKNQGGDRVGKRARDTASRFRAMLGESEKTVRESQPKVVLRIDPSLRPNESLRDKLNYDERDDQLIGTLSQFAKANPEKDARLLTHDTMPIFTAKGLNLRAEVIPDDWLRPPEKSNLEKRMTALQTENAQLRAPEPSFSITCNDFEGESISDLNLTLKRFEPLSAEEIETLIKQLQQRHPIEEEFGGRLGITQRTAADRRNGIFQLGRTFVPATDEEIEEYRSESYPAWIEKCRERLGALHRSLQWAENKISITFAAQNTGSRPATDALVTLKAQGHFLVMPPSDGDADEDKGTEKEAGNVVLPTPPKPPHGVWKNTHPFNFGTPAGVLDTQHHVGSILSRLPQERDDNAFYHKPRQPLSPSTGFAYECRQWRHDQAKENFDVEITFASDDEALSGRISCHIHAANLTTAEVKHVPVRIQFEDQGIFDIAVELIEKL